MLAGAPELSVHMKWWSGVGVMLTAGIPRCEIGATRSSLPAMMTSCPALRTAAASGVQAKTVAGLPAVTKRNFMRY
jgi:hypothetical protein